MWRVLEAEGRGTKKKDAVDGSDELQMENQHRIQQPGAVGNLDNSSSGECHRLYSDPPQNIVPSTCERDLIWKGVFADGIKVKILR